MPRVQPGAPGAYVLVLRTEDCEFAVGALGPVFFPAGLYAYVGSALGPGGVQARLARHCRASKRLHWHIDYLTAIAPVIATFSRLGNEPQECAWGRALLALPGASTPARGFGSSDCRSGCPAHLVRLPGFEPRELESYLCPTTTWFKY